MASLLAAGLATEAGAQPPADGHDLHTRPAEYNDPLFAVPPLSANGTDYPLAVGFTPAHSSNYTAGGLDPQYVVVHTMQGYYGGSISWFQNPAANVSAHYCMRAEDGEITQMVRDSDRAWHVGTSNPVALGIEHEGFVDDASWYTWVTYLESARLARWLCDTYDIPIDRDHVVGHVELPNQTHGDPGPNWDWDLYMALIEDVVPEGRIEGVVVDRARACTVTTTQGTWLKTTAEASDTLADDQLCWVDADTELRVLHELDAISGHRRLVLDDDEPCAETLGGAAGYAFDGHVEGACALDSAAAAGITIELDGGDSVQSDAEGRFSFTGVEAGAHTLDLRSGRFVATMVPVELDVYPGVRVVVAVDARDGEPPGGSTGGDPGEGGATGDTDEDPLDPTSGEEPPGGTEGDPMQDDDQTVSLPPNFGERDGGCSCRSSGRGFGPMHALLGAGLLVLGWRRRR